jgi:hypothetical protein
MSDYQKGRTSAVFSAGSKVDDLQEVYEKEASNLEAMKLAFGMAGKALENYRAAMLKELEEAKIPLKEAEYGKVYIGRCIELMRQMFNDTEAKRLQARGAAEAMKQAVASIKRLYDEERAKLASHDAWEKDPNRDPKDRPVGADPGTPLEDYKRTTEEEAKTPKKRGRTKAGG